MAYKYTFKDYDKEHMARAVLESVPISFKSAVMTANAIRGKELNKAKNILKQAISKKTPIRFTKFNHEQAHRKAIGPGKYPVKTAKYVLKLLDEIEANAQSIGLDTSSLIVHRVICHEASRSLHYGRRRNISMKRTTIEIIVKESVMKNKSKKNKSGKKEKAEDKSKKSKVKVAKEGNKENKERFEEAAKKKTKKAAEEKIRETVKEESKDATHKPDERIEKVKE